MCVKDFNSHLKLYARLAPQPAYGFLNLALFSSESKQGPFEYFVDVPHSPSGRAFDFIAVSRYIEVVIRTVYSRYALSLP